MSLHGAICRASRRRLSVAEKRPLVDERSNVSDIERLVVARVRKGDALSKLAFFFLFSCVSVLLIPFLTELRELMDWCFTKTTLDMTIWFKVQDIWHEAFITKSRRKRESVRSSNVFLGGRRNVFSFSVLLALLVKRSRI